MKAIRKFVSDEYLEQICRDHFIHDALLNLLPSKLREDLSHLKGIPNDKLAEIVVAFGKGIVAIDGAGMDYNDGTECKFANLFHSPEIKNGVQYIKKKAKVSNLHSKTGDLHVIVCDAISEIGKVGLRFFSFPYTVWKQKIKADSFALSFGSNRHKWYMDYEYSWDEFCSGKRGLENFV